MQNALNQMYASNKSVSIFDAMIPHQIVISFQKRAHIKKSSDSSRSQFLVLTYLVMDLLSERPLEKISISE